MGPSSWRRSRLFTDRAEIAQPEQLEHRTLLSRNVLLAGPEFEGESILGDPSERTTVAISSTAEIDAGSRDAGKRNSERDVSAVATPPRNASGDVSKSRDLGNPPSSDTGLTGAQAASRSVVPTPIETSPSSDALSGGRFVTDNTALVGGRVSTLDPLSEENIAALPRDDAASPAPDETASPLNVGSVSTRSTPQVFSGGVSSAAIHDSLGASDSRAPSRSGTRAGNTSFDSSLRADSVLNVASEASPKASLESLERTSFDRNVVADDVESRSERDTKIDRTSESDRGEERADDSMVASNSSVADAQADEQARADRIEDVVDDLAPDSKDKLSLAQIALSIVEAENTDAVAAAVERAAHGAPMEAIAATANMAADVPGPSEAAVAIQSSAEGTGATARNSAYAAVDGSDEGLSTAMPNQQASETKSNSKGPSTKVAPALLAVALGKPLSRLTPDSGANSGGGSKPTTSTRAMEANSRRKRYRRIALPLGDGSGEADAPIEGHTAPALRLKVQLIQPSPELAVHGGWRAQEESGNEWTLVHDQVLEDFGDDGDRWRSVNGEVADVLIDARSAAFPAVEAAALIATLAATAGAAAHRRRERMRSSCPHPILHSGTTRTQLPGSTAAGSRRRYPEPQEAVAVR